jgi:hypothetical protein
MENGSAKDSSLAQTRLSKNILSFSIKLFLTTAILYLALSSVPTKDYQHALAILSTKPLLIILSLVILQVFLLANRWYLLAKSAGSRLSHLKSIYGILISFFFHKGYPPPWGGTPFGFGGINVKEFLLGQL